MSPDQSETRSTRHTCDPTTLTIEGPVRIETPDGDWYVAYSEKRPCEACLDKSTMVWDVVEVKR